MGRANFPTFGYPAVALLAGCVNLTRPAFVDERLDAGPGLADVITRDASDDAVASDRPAPMDLSPGMDMGGARDMLPRTPGLAGHWPLDEGSGSSTADLSGGGLTGQLVNGPTWVAGRKGRGLGFRDVGDHVSLGKPSALELTGAMTVSAWVNIETYRTGSIVTKLGGSMMRGWFLELETTGAIRFGVAIDRSSTFSVDAPPQPTRVWIHVAGVYEPSQTVRIFVNGVRAGIRPGAPSAQYNAPSTDVRLGLRPDNLDGLDGAIDEVRIYNRALSDVEVMMLFTNP